MVYVNAGEAKWRRTKKLIAVARCTFPKVAVTAYNCVLCDDAEKEKRGCVVSTGCEIWKITPCFECGGNDKNCLYCHGSNNISVDRCPRAIAHEAKWPMILLPFFYDYYFSLQNGNIIWPESGGRINQVVKLVQAFDILTEEYYNCHKDNKHG